MFKISIEYKESGQTITTNHVPPRSNCNNWFSFSFTILNYFGYDIPKHGNSWSKKYEHLGGILITVTFYLSGPGTDGFHPIILFQYLWSFSFLFRQMSDLLAQKTFFSLFGSKSPR